MPVLEVEPMSRGEIEPLLEGEGDFGIAVDALVVDSQCRWLLHRRGRGCRDEVGRLEGLGGSVDPHEGFREALSREVREEAGDDLVIVIDRFVAGRIFRPERSHLAERPWLVLSYLCLLLHGEPRIAEPRKNAGFVRVVPDEVDADELSRSARESWRWLRQHDALVRALAG